MRLGTLSTSCNTVLGNGESKKVCEQKQGLHWHCACPLPLVSPFPTPKSPLWNLF